MPNFLRRVLGGQSVGAGSKAPRSYRGDSMQVNDYKLGAAPPFSAVGLTGSYSQTDLGGFRYLTFSSGGTMNVVSAGEAQVLVVAGGSAGGSGGSGGGGGGGVRVATGTTFALLPFSLKKLKG